MISKTIHHQLLLIGLLCLSSQTLFAANQPTNTASEAAEPIIKKLTLNSPHLSSPIDTPIACTADALAAAITIANNADNSAGGGLVVIPANCTIQISTPATSTTGLPDITGNVTIFSGGKSTVISRDPLAPSFRIFNVNSGASLKLRNLTVENGKTTGLGGGIQNAGTLVLMDVILTHNEASNGGGLSVANGATANAYNTGFINNSTTAVGGGGAINFGTLNIQNSLFSGNTAPINGGGLNTQSGGITSVSHSNIFHNTSGGLGGGLSNLGSTNIVYSAVKSNTGSSGGGIATGNTNVLLHNAFIVSNNPDNCSPLNTISGCVN